MSELFKCVITPNLNRYAPPSPAVITIPAGTTVIECFSFDRRGREIVHETFVPGIGFVNGKITAKK